jgi:hypothetical protein
LGIMQTFGYRVRLSLHVWLLAPMLALLMASSHRRCGVECRAPAAEYYAPHYEAIVAPFLPMQSLAVFAPQTLALPTGCWQRCVAVHSFVQMFVGFLAPSAILAALEEDSRLQFLEDRGGPGWLLRFKGLAAYTVLLMLPAAVVVAALADTLAQLAGWYSAQGGHGAGCAVL